MSTDLQKYDAWLQQDGPAALVLREYYQPVDGPDGVIFPATFAAGDKGKGSTFPGGYNVDELPDGTNVCLIDSVGSQANRIEPLFARPEYADLIPQITIKAGEKEVSILDAGHRAGDALLRCTELQKELSAAFRSVLMGNALPLAQVAPTSLIFGVWDSRDTQAKLARLLSSTIRAFKVQRLTRSSVYIPPLEYVKNQLLDEAKDKATEDLYSERGFKHAPSSASPGGVIAQGGIRRDAILNLAALRMISAGKDPETTRKLQRYLLGLGLTAFTYNPGGYLRQGCILVLNPDQASELVAVGYDGKRHPLALTHDQALTYAKQTASAFGVGANRPLVFDPKRAKDDLVKDKKKKSKDAE